MNGFQTASEIVDELTKIFMTNVFDNLFQLMSSLLDQSQSQPYQNVMHCMTHISTVINLPTSNDIFIVDLISNFCLLT